MQDLQENILKTIIWFDLFEYPLKLEEIFLYLPDKVENLEFILNNLITENKIQKKQDFYFLFGRQEIVNIRKERRVESFKKIKRAKRAVKFLRNLPFVRAIFLCNVLGYLNAKEQDDIDFLIITEKNKIWTTRWFATGFFKILNLRPRPDKIKDKFCFSFYLSLDNLNLENIKLEDDPYLKYWLTGLLPLYDENNYLDKILNNNLWTGFFCNNKQQPCHPELVSGFGVKSRNEFGMTSGPFGMTSGPFGMTKKINGDSRSIIKIFLEKIFKFVFLEKIFRKIQLMIMPQILKSQMNKSGGVIINNKILKMHPYDKRKEFAEKFSHKIREIIK